MSEKIEPALTPEEWAEGVIGFAMPLNGTPHIHHAAIALCNAALPAGDLRKFTWDDVDALRRMAKSAEWAAEYANGGDGSAEAAAAISPLESLADRIAALLPPRTP